MSGPALQHGDFAQKIKRGSNVHIVDRIELDEFGRRVVMACGGSWHAGALDHVDSDESDPRACRRCWAAMTGAS